MKSIRIKAVATFKELREWGHVSSANNEKRHAQPSVITAFVVRKPCEAVNKIPTEPWLWHLRQLTPFHSFCAQPRVHGVVVKRRWLNTSRWLSQDSSRLQRAASFALGVVHINCLSTPIGILNDGWDWNAWTEASRAATSSRTGSFIAWNHWIRQY